MEPVMRDDVASMLGVSPDSLRIVIERSRARGLEVPAPINPTGQAVYDRDDWLRWAVAAGRLDDLSPADQRRARRLTTQPEP